MKRYKNRGFEENLMIETCSISSGSNGNSYFIKTRDGSFLVDAGISYKQLCLRLNSIKSDISNITGIFITHEHIDHIRGLNMLIKKNNIPIYMTKKTYEAISISEKNITFFNMNQEIVIGKTIIKSFSKCHDASEPCGFTFEYSNHKICVLTDIGVPCENTIKHVKDSNILYLEANYDEIMLMKSGYPNYLKERIQNTQGHLSNYDAGLFILQHASDNLKYVFLSHLSENNNTPERAFNTFTSITSERKDLNFKTLMTSRYDVSEIVKID